jgi:hypothetical protein
MEIVSVLTDFIMTNRKIHVLSAINNVYNVMDLRIPIV